MTRFFHRNFVFVILTDILLVAFAWYFSHLLRFNFIVPSDQFQTLIRLLPLIVGIKILSFILFDLYHGMWRYTSLADLSNIIKACSVGSVVTVLMVLFAHGFGGVSRAVFIIDWVLTLLLISGSRVGIRLYFWLCASDVTTRLNWKRFVPLFERKTRTVKRLLIVGAGDYGEKIYREIRDNPRLGYQVVGFIDDDPEKTDLKIHGIPVLGKTTDIQAITTRVKADEVLVAISSFTSQRMRALVEHCKEMGIPSKTVPGIGELINGKVTVKAIRDVSYRDLLGREPVMLDEAKIGQYLKGKRVMITGAGGSIGSELCRQVCRYDPERIILLERAESPLYDIELELKDAFRHIRIIPKLADILDLRRLNSVFDNERPQVLFHAAAYKHVPMLELQPWEAVTNNIRGTQNLINKAREFQVEQFVFVSTDKAVRPANVMGASKRVAEILIQAQNGCGLTDTRFLTVRFGNVLGSVGSVVPLFMKQIEKGGPVTVTHPDITRYFMTIPEACQLILQAGSMGTGGEIFILDMGRPIRIVDMARDLIRLSGFEPEVDIEIVYTGLRPGEKIQEELITDGEGIVPTSHKKIMVLKGPVCNLEALNGEVDRLYELAVDQDGENIKKELIKVLPEYRPMAAHQMEETGGSQ
jgi:FlaA1/EpsC-like NDP-sugar epimerase